jgi:hypothetical protein
MFRLLAILSVVVVAVTTSAYANDKPALTCKDLSLPLNGFGPNLPVSISLSPTQVTAQCTSATGDQLALVTPKGGITIASTAGQSKAVTFTVHDSHGHTASAKLTVGRD